MDPSSFDPKEDSPDLDNTLLLRSPSNDYIYFVNIKNENKDRNRPELFLSICAFVIK